MTEMDFSDKDRLKKLFKDILNVQVAELNLELTMSTVIGLADLAEDEIIAPAIPMEVKINIQGVSRPAKSLFRNNKSL